MQRRAEIPYVRNIVEKTEGQKRESKAAPPPNPPPPNLQHKATDERHRQEGGGGRWGRDSPREGRSVRCQVRM
ncbi:hypothetical protein K438DRAFT_1827475 [Mycena galopus ATCC 62051]|nr:hypothetical protein K438DRAFT_1827475 [Mycena galopus ATCC 62051]